MIVYVDSRAVLSYNTRFTIAKVWVEDSVTPFKKGLFSILETSSLNGRRWAVNLKVLYTLLDKYKSISKWFLCIIT